MSYLARIKNIIVNDLQSANNVIIEVTNPNSYQYMLQFENGTVTPFQSSPFFDNVPGGIHEVTIENLDGCGQIYESFAVISVPKFFTPNNDGFNDYWNVKGVKVTLDTNSVIYIYDRYGKLLKQWILSSNEGWDGTFNGSQLPSDDYWYAIKFENNKVVKGHFSLQR